MDLFTNIRDGKYSNNTVAYANRSEDPEQYAAFMKEENRLHSLFWEDAKAYARQEGVPEVYVDKVVHHAWSSGHAYGHSEVANHLSDLTEIFS